MSKKVNRNLFWKMASNIFKKLGDMAEAQAEKVEKADLQHKPNPIHDGRKGENTRSINESGYVEKP